MNVTSPQPIFLRGTTANRELLFPHFLQLFGISGDKREHWFAGAGRLQTLRIGGSSAHHSSQRPCAHPTKHMHRGNRRRGNLIIGGVESEMRMRTLLILAALRHIASTRERKWVAKWKRI